MATQTRMTIESRFPAAAAAAYEAVAAARVVWMEVGQKTAQAKLDSQASARGYNLSIGIGKEPIGFQSARIFTAAHSQKWGDDPWWTRFFEYGDLYIPAMPFIRPGARRANKAFLSVMGEHGIEKFLRAKPFRRKTL